MKKRHISLNNAASFNRMRANIIEAVSVVFMLMFVSTAALSATRFPSEITLNEDKPVSGNRYFPVYIGMQWQWNASVPQMGITDASVQETIVSGDGTIFNAEKIAELNGDVVARENKVYSVINGAVFIKRHEIAPEGAEPLELIYSPPCLIMPANPWVRRNWMCKTVRDIDAGTITVIEEFNVEQFESVTLESGGYGECARVNHLVTSIVRGVPTEIESTEWYCPGVGLVKVEEGGLEKLALKVSRDVSIEIPETVKEDLRHEPIPETEKIAEAEPAEAESAQEPVKEPDIDKFQDQGSSSYVLKIDGGVLRLKSADGGAGTRVKIIGWSDGGDYLSFIEKAPSSMPGQAKVGLYIMDVSRGRTMMKYERYLCLNEALGCSPGDIRISGGDEELDMVVVEENTENLRVFSIGNDPGQILAEPESKGNGEHVAVILSPNRKSSYSMVLIGEGVNKEPREPEKPAPVLQAAVGNNETEKVVLSSNKNEVPEPKKKMEESVQVAEPESPVEQEVVAEAELNVPIIEPTQEKEMAPEKAGKEVKPPEISIPTKEPNVAPEPEIKEVEAPEERPAAKPQTEYLHFECPSGMARIEPGQFKMGCSDEEDVSCLEDEKPPHMVEITKPFCISRREVTQAEYNNVKGRNPSSDKMCGKGCPVESVRWDEAVEYCSILGGRLPTEAEWEYAARAGADAKFSWGSDRNQADDYAWYWMNSENSLNPVGKKKPNGFGLNDMAGNVWEWVQDCYDADYYKRAKGENPVNDATGCESRVIKGGSWINSNASDLRVSIRGGNDVSRGSKYVGFRCVADLISPEPAMPERVAISEPEVKKPEPAEEKPIKAEEKKPEQETIVLKIEPEHIDEPEGPVIEDKKPVKVQREEPVMMMEPEETLSGMKVLDVSKLNKQPEKENPAEDEKEVKKPETVESVGMKISTPEPVKRETKPVENEIPKPEPKEEMEEIRKDVSLGFEEKSVKGKENLKYILVASPVSLMENSRVSMNLGAEDGLRAGMAVRIFKDSKWAADVRISEVGYIVSTGKIINMPAGVRSNGGYILGNVVLIPLD